MVRDSRDLFLVLLVSVGAMVMVACGKLERDRDEKVQPAARADASNAARPTSEPVTRSDQAVALEGAPQAKVQVSALSEREAAILLSASASCQRAKSLKKVLATNPLASNEARVNLVEAERKCASAPGADTADVQELLLRAAELGNVDAAACFVSGALLPPQSTKGQRERADELRRRETPALIEQGIAAGNWAMVAEAAAINRPRSAHGPYGAFGDPDPVKGYTYMKLMELGAEGIEKLELQVSALEFSRSMDSMTRKKMDQAAERMYREYFHDREPYSHESIALCEDF